MACIIANLKAAIIGLVIVVPSQETAVSTRRFLPGHICCLTWLIKFRGEKESLSGFFTTQSLAFLRFAFNFEMA